MKLEGVVSRKVIRLWLENYQALTSGDRIPEAVVFCSRKADDGIGGTFLNRVMLEKAIGQLERAAPKVYACCKARWIEPQGLGETLRALVLSKSAYYRACDRSVDFIYYQVNGKAANLLDLIKAIQKDF
jgi:hypothetical protein